MRVIGTAGHVDHGKSTLVKALTGIDPDRLKEEKERAMTIDLGFAWFTLPSGESVSVVDVPGHEHFIKNMLAGVGGIDAAMLVIAADEGIMPQTREHIAILDLLHVNAAVVALTKSDLIDDPEWFALIGADIRRELSGTSLAGAHIVPVSARTRQGLDALKRELDELLAQTAARADWGKPRLPVDRVFTIAGFGTVVTGTLADGSFSAGQEVEIQPTGLKARIRGLQSHKEKVEFASPGRRLAINLTGVSPDEVKRGDVVAGPGVLSPTQMIDVRLRWLPAASGPLTHDAELEFFSGAFQTLTRVRLLGDEELPAGKEGWAQLVLADPAALATHDCFIVRQPSPSLTVGGGVIVDAHPAERHRRFKPEVVERLARLAHGTPEEIVLETLSRSEPVAAEDALKQSSLPRAEAEAALHTLREAGTVIALDEQTLMTLAGWRRVLETLRSALAAYHRQVPLRGGIPREELRSRMRLPARVFDLAAARAAREGVIAESPTSVRLASHAVTYTSVQEAKVKQVMAALVRERFAPPSYDECAAMAGADLLAALIEQERIVRVNESVVFDAGAYREMVERIRAHLHAHGAITVAQVRDMFNASRKYALGMMEHLDDIKLTRRVGDERVLRG
ncbi:MAG: selenocysteine-specific translation elongation factor [Chloroflexi bacterium]|nr:selenocysteine-specific translation elongation factor [Chloroflexota bacterium]